MDSSSINILRQLSNLLLENKYKFEFLNKIDRAMVDPELILEEFVHSTLLELTKFTKSDNIYFFIDARNEFLVFTSAYENKKIKTLPYDLFDDERGILGENSKEFNKENGKKILDYFLEMEGIIVYPIIPKNMKRFGIVVLESLVPNGIMIDDSMREISFSSTMQLTNGIGIYLKEKFSNSIMDLSNKFFDFDLEPYECFKQLANSVKDFLPMHGPLNIRSKIGVQVLIYYENGKYLKIVGTTGEDLGKKVRQDKSVVGLLFDKTNRDCVLGNPTTDNLLREKFRSYLNINTKTELALPVTNYEGKRFAVINLESDEENAFKYPHIEALQKFCEKISFPLNALFRNLENIEKGQEAILYTQRSYWNSIGQLLRHNTNSPLLAIRFAADNIETIVGDSEYKNKISSKIETIGMNIKMASDEIKRFSDEIHDYNISGKYSIRNLINDAVSIYRQRVDNQLKNIMIKINDGKDFDIYASEQLKVHIYNFIDNSVYWIKKRKEIEPKHIGKILISIKEGPKSGIKQEKELNENCDVIIEDNGLGCPEDQIKNIFRTPVESLRSKESGKGLGIALFAAKNFMDLIKGEIWVESKQGEYFKIFMRFAIFKSAIHKVIHF